jgi:hypothetical protein
MKNSRKSFWIGVVIHKKKACQKVSTPSNTPY